MGRFLVVVRGMRYYLVIWETRKGRLKRRAFFGRAALQAAHFLETREKRVAIVHNGRVVYSSVRIGMDWSKTDSIDRVLEGFM